MILSPMPPMTKPKKPTVYHCPWKAGSLLAYRIVSNTNLSDHPCFMKYVLLRVIRVKKNPLSTRFDTGYYDESMLVGLYNWMGSVIPHTEIVHILKYIPIEESMSPFTTKETRSVWLNWRSSKYETGDLTFLGIGEDFQNNIPAFFASSLNSCVFTHFLPFDVTLSKKFEPYWHDRYNLDYVLI